MRIASNSPDARETLDGLELVALHTLESGDFLGALLVERSRRFEASYRLMRGVSH